MSVCVKGGEGGESTNKIAGSRGCNVSIIVSPLLYFDFFFSPIQTLLSKLHLSVPSLLFSFDYRTFVFSAVRCLVCGFLFFSVILYDVTQCPLSEFYLSKESNNADHYHHHRFICHTIKKEVYTTRLTFGDRASKPLYKK